MRVSYKLNAMLNKIGSKDDNNTNLFIFEFKTLIAVINRI